MVERAEVMRDAAKGGHMTMDRRGFGMPCSGAGIHALRERHGIEEKG